MFCLFVCLFVCLTHTLTACNFICGKPLRLCIQDAHARPIKLRVILYINIKMSMPKRPINKHAGIIVKVKKGKEEKKRKGAKEATTQQASKQFYWFVITLTYANMLSLILWKKGERHYCILFKNSETFLCLKTVSKKRYLYYFLPNKNCECENLAYFFCQRQYVFLLLCFSQILGLNGFAVVKAYPIIHV